MAKKWKKTNKTWDPGKKRETIYGIQDWRHHFIDFICSNFKWQKKCDSDKKRETIHGMFDGHPYFMKLKKQTNKKHVTQARKGKLFREYKTGNTILWNFICWNLKGKRKTKNIWPRQEEGNHSLNTWWRQHVMKLYLRKFWRGNLCNIINVLKLNQCKHMILQWWKFITVIRIYHCDKNLSNW